MTLVFIHGGGWRLGSRGDMHTLMYSFYKKGYPCVSVDYRLKGVSVSEQLADVREGMASASTRLKAQGLHQSFVLYGSSAGGHLALLAGLAPVGICGEQYDGASLDIAGIVASCAPITFEPWDDIFPGSWESMQLAVGKDFATDPECYRLVSPEQYTTVDSPPILFMLGECEHMFPNSLTIKLVERIRAQGGRAEYNIYSSAEHGFFYDIHRRAQGDAFQDMLMFLDRLKLAQIPSETEQSTSVKPVGISAK